MTISNSLIHLIKVLDKKSHKAFKLWLSSPLMNTKEELLSLYLAISYHPLHGKEMLSKEEIWKQVFEGIPFEEKQWNYNIHWLLNQLRDFTSWQEWQKDDDNQALYQCRALRKLGQKKLFSKAYQKQLKRLDDSSIRNGHYYQQQFMLRQEFLAFSSLHSKNNIPEMVAESDFFLQTAHEFYHLTARCQPILEKALIAYHRTAEPPAGIQVYKALRKANQNRQDVQLYYDAKKLFQTHLAIFQKEEQRDLLLLLLNFAIHQMNTGNTDFESEVFSLYEEGIQRDILLENNEISKLTFKNIVATGLRLKKTAWVYTFIEKYKKHLPALDRQSTYIYNLATYFCSLPDLDKAMELLVETDWDKDIYYALDARCLLLRIYFEKDYQESLASLLDSFQVFLKRNSKTIGYHKESYDNLIKTVRKMVRFSSLNPITIEELKTQVKKLDKLAERVWLLEQIDLLDTKGRV